MAGMGGFFLGGLGDALQQGWQNQQMADFRQQELKLRAQSEQNAQTRFEMARMDKIREDVWNVLETTITTGLALNQDPKVISQHTGEMVKMLRKFDTARGFPDLTDSQINALYARGAAVAGEGQPSAEQPPAAPTGPSAAGPTPAAAGQPTQAIPDIAQSPAIGGSVNLTGPDRTSTVLSTQPIPPGAPATAPSIGAPSALAPPAAPTRIASAAPTSFASRFEGEPAAPAAGGPVTTPPVQTQPVPGVQQGPTAVDPARVQALTRSLALLPKDNPLRAVKEAELREALAEQKEKPSIHQVTRPDGSIGFVQIDRNGVQTDVIDRTLGGMEQAKIADAMKNNLTGPAFLEALPPEKRKEIQAIATYKINPQTISNRGGERDRAIAWTAQYTGNTYDQTVYASKNKAMQVLGNREGAIVGAIENAKATAQRVLETSKMVPRTNYPNINALLMASNEALGDPNVVKFKIAVGTYIYNYARAMGGSSSVLTDNARAEATALMQRAWSQGQIEAAIGQMDREMRSELSGTKSAIKRIPEEFSGTEGAGDTTTPSTPAAAPTAKPAGGDWKVERID